MVLLSPGDAILFILLLLCVPLQLWIQQQTSLPSTEARDGQVFIIIRDIHKLLQKYVSPHYWSTVLHYKYSDLQIEDKDIREYARLSYEQLTESPNMTGECPAVEVMRVQHPHGYFAAGVHQRRYRTSLVKFRVGQVVRHSQYGLKGVIIGWDEDCQAPQHFIRHSYDPDAVTELCGQPNYAVLIDTSDFPTPITQYFAQKYLEPITNTKVDHPQMDVYFDKFDGSRFLMTGWLAAIYPED